VAWALGQIGDARAVEPLINALERGYDPLMVNAALALGRLGDPEAVKPLRRVLFSWASLNPDVARAACEALVMIGQPTVEEFLPDLIRIGRHWASRELAAWPLGRIGDLRALEPMLRARSLLAGDSLLLEALADFGVRAVEPLIGFLRDTDEYARETSATVLGMIGDAQAFAPLTEALQDTDGHLDLRVDPVTGYRSHEPPFVFFRRMASSTDRSANARSFCCSSRLSSS
jgi:HEAT repeat protein